MKNIFIKLSLVFALTVLMSFVWLRYPNLFPSLTEEHAISLVDFFGAKNGEQIADLEVNLVLVLSLVFSTMLVLIIDLIRKLIIK